MPTSQKLQGEWKQVSGAVKQKYGDITDDEIRQTEGSLQKLIGLIQEKTGQSSEQVEAYVHELTERARAGYEASAKVVSERPVESVLAAFTVGAIAGLLIGLSVASARQPAPTWRNAWRG